MDQPSAFPSIDKPRQWAAKGIYGEKIWLTNKDMVPPGHRAILRLLIGVGLIGGALLAWGLITLTLWPTSFGSTLIVLGQLWRIDRFGQLYDTVTRDGFSWSCIVTLLLALANASRSRFSITPRRRLGCTLIRAAWSGARGHGHQDFVNAAGQRVKSPSGDADSMASDCKLSPAGPPRGWPCSV